jgi:hypothetical protein
MRPLRAFSRTVSGLALLVGCAAPDTSSEPAAQATPLDSAAAAGTDPHSRTDVVRLGGSMIGTDSSSRHAFSHFQAPEGRLLVLSELVSHDSAGRAVWRALDVVVTPVIAQGSDLLGSFCRRRGVPDSSLAAIVRREEAEYVRATEAAWQADLTQGRLRSVPVLDIDCANEGLGA